MAGEQGQGALFPDARSDESAVVVNDRCMIRTHEGHRLVLVCGLVLAQYAVDDHMAEAHAIVSMVEQGWADQNDVARAFARSSRTVRRYQRRVETGGLAALARPSGYPRGRARVKPRRLRLVACLKAEGFSNRAIAQREGVSEKAVRNLLRRAGWSPSSSTQAPLPLPVPGADPNPSAFPRTASSAAPVAPSDSRGSKPETTGAGADAKLSAVRTPPEDPLPVQAIERWMRRNDTQRIQIDIVVLREGCFQQRIDVFVHLCEPLVTFLHIGQHRFNVGFPGLLFAKFALRGVCLGELGLGPRLSFPGLFHSARQYRVCSGRLARSPFILASRRSGGPLQASEESSTRHV